MRARARFFGGERQDSESRWSIVRWLQTSCCCARTGPRDRPQNDGSGANTLHLDGHMTYFTPVWHPSDRTNPWAMRAGPTLDDCPACGAENVQCHAPSASWY